MSLNLQGEKCAVCTAYLFEEDDIVYCPICGAPHHRDCYNAIGKCGLEEYHGTDNQYKRPEPKIVEQKKETSELNLTTCAMCDEKFDINEDACPKCNAPNMSKFGGRVINIDFMGGVPEDTDLGNGVIAKDAKKFVRSNTHRYIPKFLKFKLGKKASWNWLALISPCGWLLSRKMYILGCIAGAVQIALTMLTVPFASAVNQLDLSAAQNSFEIAQIVIENMAIVGETSLYIATVGSLANLFIAILFAIFGDYIYCRHALGTISELKNNKTLNDEILRKKGGVNFFAAILGYFIVSELPSIIASVMGLI